MSQPALAFANRDWLLIPSISGIGGAYVLSATLENPTTGASLKSGIVRASKKEDVFNISSRCWLCTLTTTRPTTTWRCTIA